jgi:hypothetical protein
MMLVIYGMQDRKCPALRQDLIDAVFELKLRTDNLTIGCPINRVETLGEEFAGLHNSQAFSLDCLANYAALVMHKSQDVMLGASAVVHYQSRSYRIPLTMGPASHRVQVCSKVYGNGGKIGSDGYLEWWMAQWHALGVSQVVVYVLDTTVPKTMSNFVAHNPHGRELVLRSWPPRHPHTQAVYRSQSETAASEIEVSYRTAMAHCATDAIGRVDWVLEVDLDEVVVLGPKSQPGMSIGQAAFGVLPPPVDTSFAAFDLTCEPIRHHNKTKDAFHVSKPWLDLSEEWGVALEASNNFSKRARYQNTHEAATGWKSMWRPEVAHFVTAHGPPEDGVENGRELTTSHLAHVETAYLVHCRRPDERS